MIGAGEPPELLATGPGAGRRTGSSVPAVDGPVNAGESWGEAGDGGVGLGDCDTIAGAGVAGWGRAGGGVPGCVEPRAGAGVTFEAVVAPGVRLEIKPGREPPAVGF